MKTNKPHYVLLVLLSLFSFYCGSSNQDEGKYFMILARTEDDSLFVVVQEEMSIQPMMKYFVLIINVKSDNPDNHYIVFGDEKDKYSIKMAWSSLSLDTRQRLLNYRGVNKNDTLKNKGPIH